MTTLTVRKMAIPKRANGLLIGEPARAFSRHFRGKSASGATINDVVLVEMCAADPCGVGPKATSRSPTADHSSCTTGLRSWMMNQFDLQIREQDI